LSFAIRDATPADETVLTRFLRDLQDAEAAICTSRRPGREVDRWCYRELRAHGVQVLLAMEGSQVVGFVAGRLAVHDDELQIAAWRPHGHISDLYVDPAYRANGFGQGLLRAMIERLQAMGAQRVRIAALSANAAAIRLYRRLGFQPFSIALDLDLTPGAF
jgi:ribosomal protein S18 acetylase RimI-like enzyme